MQYAEYINEVKKRIDTLQKEGNLEKWILQYAREVSLDNRKWFLEKLVYQEQDDAAVLEDFNAFIRDIEDDTYYMKVDFEAYHSWYDNDYTYIDVFAIGSRLEEYYRIAEEKVDEGELDIAHKILQGLNQISVDVSDDDDDDSYDYIEYPDLSLYDLCLEDLCSIPYEEFCSLTLYVIYQLNSIEQRAERIVDCMLKNKYKPKLLNDLFDVVNIGRDEKNAFLDDMKVYLCHEPVS